MIPYSWLETAAERIAPHINQTPLTYDPDQNLYIKWENKQVTGSFKARGALNKVLTLQAWERQRGLVAASAGNHGQGVALAGKLTGAPVIIFASEHAVPAKIDAMQALGAEVRLVPGGYSEAEQSGKSFAEATDSTWISPYNDGQIIAGQGTLGLEIIKEDPLLGHATWVVPVGGGGLISGIGAAIKNTPLPLEAGFGPKLIGVQSKASPFFHAIFKQGSQEGVIELDSLADGLAGPVEANSATIPLVKQYVDDIILVHESDIVYAIKFAWDRYHERIEGSAAAALAAVLTGKITTRPLVLVSSGGNIQPEVHAQIIEGKPAPEIS